MPDICANSLRMTQYKVLNISSLLYIWTTDLYHRNADNNSEWSTRTKAAPTVRRAFAPAPLYSDFGPSSLTIVVMQSKAPW